MERQDKGGTHDMGRLKQSCKRLVRLSVKPSDSRGTAVGRVPTTLAPRRAQANDDYSPHRSRSAPKRIMHTCLCRASLHAVLAGTEWFIIGARERRGRRERREAGLGWAAGPRYISRRIHETRERGCE
jgi:hypothetical protein